MDTCVIDNFLSNAELNNLKNDLNHNESFPLYYTTKVSGKEKKGNDDYWNYYFAHVFYDHDAVKSHYLEKFYNVLASASAIPIVFGPSKSEYEAVAPPYSFIHVNDFKNPEDLADYMNYLIDNSTAYMEYFWWTSYYTVKRTELICSFCEKMYSIRIGRIQNTAIKN